MKEKRFQPDVFGPFPYGKGSCGKGIGIKMEKLDKEYGQLKIRLSELIEEKGLNRNQVSIMAAMNWKQVDRYCENDIFRLDIFVLCKLCTALECNIQDLLLFIPADNKPDG